MLKVSLFQKKMGTYSIFLEIFSCLFMFIQTGFTVDCKYLLWLYLCNMFGHGMLYDFP